MPPDVLQEEMLQAMALLISEVGLSPKTVTCPVDPEAGRRLAQTLAAEALEGRADLVLVLDPLDRGTEGLAVQRDLGAAHLVVLPLDRALLVEALPDEPQGRPGAEVLAQQVLEESGYAVARLQPWPPRGKAGTGWVRGALRRHLGRGEEVLALCRPWKPVDSVQSPCGRWGYQPSEG